MPTTSTPKKIAAGAMVLGLAFGGLAACSDEDGDGAVTDEEVDQIDESVDSVVDEAGDELDDADVDASASSLVEQGEQEVQQGADEVDQNDAGG